MVRRRATLARIRSFLAACLFASLIVGCASTSKVARRSWRADPASGITDGRDLGSVSLSARGDVGFAVGRGGTFLRWDGIGWKRDDAAMRVAGGVDLSAVAVDASGKQALAVGGDGRILSWNGTTWKHEPAAERLAIKRSLFAVSFDEKGRTAWVVGQYGIALRWNGSEWKRILTPFAVPEPPQGGAPVEMFGMWAVWNAPNGLDAWAAGNGNRVLRWNGRIWKDEKSASHLQTVGNPFGGVCSIAMSKDGKRGWMVGGPSEGASNLTWSGSKWQTASSPAGIPNEDLFFYSVACDGTGTTAFAVGPNGNIGRWNGKEWKIDGAARAAGGSRTLLGVALSENGKIGFAVGQGGVILRLS